MTQIRCPLCQGEGKTWFSGYPAPVVCVLCEGKATITDRSEWLLRGHT